MIIERPEFRDRVRIFLDSQHAGKMLADMLSSYSKTEVIVLARTPGGVRAAIAEGLYTPCTLFLPKIFFGT
jgi:predicted phosphoribosyltransferase